MLRPGWLRSSPTHHSINRDERLKSPIPAHVPQAEPPQVHAGCACTGALARVVSYDACFADEATDALAPLAVGDLVLILDQSDTDQFNRKLRYIETTTGISAVWNNSGDTVFLRHPSGNNVLAETHAGNECRVRQRSGVPDRCLEDGGWRCDSVLTRAARMP